MENQWNIRRKFTQTFLECPTERDIARVSSLSTLELNLPVLDNRQAPGRDRGWFSASAKVSHLALLCQSEQEVDHEWPGTRFRCFLE